MKRSVITAIVIAIVAAGWLLSGIYEQEIDAAFKAAMSGGRGANAAESPPPERSLPVVAEKAEAAAEKLRMSVGTVLSTARPHRLEVVARGRTESVRSVQVKAQTEGRVEEVFKEKGDLVRQGEPIVRLAPGAREAMMAEAKALVRQREIEFTAAEQLNTKGYRAETAVAAARAALDSAKAAVKSMEVDIGYLTIRAPFDGVIAEKPVHLGAFLKVGEMVAKVVDQEPVLAVGYLSERDVARIGPQTPARVELVDGRMVEGHVRFIAPVAEPSTRTFRVEVELPNPERDIRDGVTAEIRISGGEWPAHFVSPAVLTLNDAGEVGVRAVDDHDQVAFHAVKIISDSAEGVWITGLPPRAEVITLGQEFVREGQVVDARPAPKE